MHKRNVTDLPQLFNQVVPPPKQLYIRGGPLESLLIKPRVSIVGSRRPTPYGRHITTKIASELAERGVVIVSGLALGIDSMAHQAAVAARQPTVAVLPCGLDRVYPRSHAHLAEQIIKNGGVLISEYGPETAPLKHHFIARNRLVAALCDVLLITEAALKSGSLHTARFALEQGKTVMAVPGPITSDLSQGTNNLIKSGASPVTETNDILHVLGISTVDQPQLFGDTEEEQRILDLLKTGLSDAGELQAKSRLEAAIFNQTLTMLEINGKIKPLGNNHWVIN